MHTLDIAPLRSESPPQKRSGIARVLKGFHSFTCRPTRSSAIGMSHTCLCLPSRSCRWYSFTNPGDGKLSRPWCEVAQAEIRTRNLQIANLALYHTATSAPINCLLWSRGHIPDPASGLPDHGITVLRLFCYCRKYPTALLVSGTTQPHKIEAALCGLRGCKNIDPLRFLAGCRTRRLNQV